MFCIAPENWDLGTAIIAGMKYGVEHGYKYVLNLDADFSHPPKVLPALIGGMEREDGKQVDVMIGSRYIPGGGSEGWPLKRIMMSKCVNLYARTLLGLRPKDISGSYRCYRGSLLAKMDFSDVRSKGYSFQEEILWHFKRLGAKFDETPIVFIDRLRGQSKINPNEAKEALRIIFHLGIKNWLGF